ncbi:hypothetical protein VE03_10452 [Pseudogymnoascus sp. 23342-1-I1]|nr:hypothetical protein VE03_10452 [Pseudogymnoascus sp. 23342-1-I1]
MPARKTSNKPARNYASIRKSTSPKRTSVSLCLRAALQTDNIDNPGSITEHPNDAISHWARPLVDTSAMSRILKINTKRKTALVEPNVPMDSLVEATLQHGLIPPVVMECSRKL